MDDREPEQQRSIEDSPRLPYERPELRVLGTVTELTQGDNIGGDEAGTGFSV